MFIKSIMLLIIFLFFSACTKLQLASPKAEVKKETTVTFSCEEEAPPKSLQELEKKYRCRGE